MELDHVAVTLEKTKHNERILCDKAHNVAQSADRRALFSFFAEIKTGGELYRNHYSSIQLVPETKYKTPDYTARDRATQSFNLIEVKCIFQSDSIKTSFQKCGVIMGDAGNHFIPGLFKKIESCAHATAIKCSDYAQHHSITPSAYRCVLVLQYEPDPVAIATYSGNDASLLSLTDVLGREVLGKLEKKYRIVIYPKRYF